MWELFTYGGGDFLRMILTGVAQIFGNADYMVALKSAALIGFIGVLIYAAFQKGPLDVKWIAGIIMIVMVMIVPKVNVTITDRVVIADSSVVSNIPLGLGLTATAFSKLSDWMTRSFETVFSLPNQVQYSGNGLLFASHLVEASTRFEITTPRVAANFSEFWKSCVYYDLLLELYEWDDVVESNDLMTFLGGNTSQVRSFTYKPSSGDRSIVICRTGLNNQLTTDLNTEITNSTNIQGVRLVSNAATQTAAVSRFASSMPVAYQYITGMAMTNARILAQNVLANSFKRGLSNFASEVDATAAAQDFAMARAEQERRNTFAVMGKLAKRMLPILHTIFEAFIYAIFPIVMLMAMLPVAGKVLMGYVKTLFWINMWPPLYAVLHFAMTYFGQKSAKAAVVQAGSGFPTGLSVMTHTGLGQVLADYAAIAGYLSLSIPMIAYMLVSQSGAMMAGLAGRMMQSYDAPVSRASDEATTGNQQLGNVKYETETAFQANAAPTDNRGGVSVGDGLGNNVRVTNHGQVYTDAGSSNTPLSINYGSATESSARQAVAQSTSNEQTAASNLGQSNAALLTAIDSTMERIYKSEAGSVNSSSSDSVAYSEAREEKSQILEKVAEEHGVDVQTIKAISLGLQGSTEKGGNGVSFKGGIGFEGQQIDKERYSKIIASLNSEGYSEALRAEGMAALELSKSFQIRVDNSSEDGLSAVLSNQHQASLDHSDALKEKEQASKQLDYAQQVSSSIQAKGDDGFFGWLASEQGMSNDEIAQLMREANRGDPDARQHRHNYAEDYVQSELSKYSENQVSLDNLREGNFGGNTDVFRPVNETSEKIVSEAKQNINNNAKNQVEEQHEDNLKKVDEQNKVPSKKDALGGIRRLNKEISKDRDDPTSIPMRPVENNNVNNQSERIEDKVEEQVNKTALDRLADAVSGWLK